MKKLLAIGILLIAALAFGQGSQFDFLMNQQRNASGSLAGGSATFYAAGTLTPKAIYTDIGLTNLASNPYTLSSQGKALVYGSGLYKVVVKDAAGVTQYTFDYVFVNALGGFSASQTPVAGEIPVLNSDKSMKVKTGATTRTWMKDAGAAGVRFGSLDYTAAYLTGAAAVLGAGYDPLGTSSVNSAKQTLDASGNVVVSVSTNSAVSFTNYSSWTPGRGANNSAKLSGFSAYTSSGVSRIPVSGSNGRLNANWLPPGTVIQTVTASTTTASTFSALFPDDDTIPQNTEGTQLASLTITPRLSTSKIIVRVLYNLSLQTQTAVILALFRDAGLDALAATYWTNSAGGVTNVNSTTLMYEFSPGSTSATTIYLRGGPVSAQTVTVNGWGGVRKLGGALISYVQAIEVAQ